MHETARYTNHVLMATDDGSIAGYRTLAEAVHRHGTVLFAQLFHPGREMAEADGGLLNVAYAPSSVPNERFHVMPRALKQPLIDAIVQGYGDAARRMQTAGLDGVEIVASHGYLPAQFLNPRVNLRTDVYGGEIDGRLRFLREVIADIRAKVSEGFVVGLRISGTEADEQGLTEEESLEAVAGLGGSIDYVHVHGGHFREPRGRRSHRAAHGHQVRLCGALRRPDQAPIQHPGFRHGPHQPAAGRGGRARRSSRGCVRHDAGADQRSGHAHKALRGALEDIRACIACNQACIGHFHKGFPISCIQNPVSGRELRFGAMARAASPRKVMVAGGGPGGMKAAAVAAERGHRVTLFEAQRRLGGQALLAQMLPGRAEFGGIVTNLQRELQLAGVQVHRNARVDRAKVLAESRMWCSSPPAPSPTVPPFPRKVRCKSSMHGRCCAAKQPRDSRCSSSIGAPTGSASAWPSTWRSTAGPCAWP